MKNPLQTAAFALFFTISAFAFTRVLHAGESAKAVYESLKTQPVDATKGMGATIERKMVKGLSCDKISKFSPDAQPKYECLFSIDDRSDEDIYNSLDTEEVDVTNGQIGGQNLAKIVGSLKCVKSTPAIANPQPRYSCIIFN